MADKRFAKELTMNLKAASMEVITEAIKAMIDITAVEDIMEAKVLKLCWRLPKQLWLPRIARFRIEEDRIWNNDRN